jgi:hypothetical protein
VNIVVFYTGPLQYLLYKKVIQKFNNLMKIKVAVQFKNCPMTEDTDLINAQGFHLQHFLLKMNT